MPDYILHLDRHLFHFINHNLGNTFFDALMPVLRNRLVHMGAALCIYICFLPLAI